MVSDFKANVCPCQDYTPDDQADRQGTIHHDQVSAPFSLFDSETEKLVFSVTFRITLAFASYLRICILYESVNEYRLAAVQAAKQAFFRRTFQFCGRAAAELGPN
jgi:hypothetical protein